MKDPVARRRLWMRARIALLCAFVFGGAGAVVYRAYELQILRADELGAMARQQYLRDVKLAPKRGTIFDRHGAELAVSVDVDSVWANPRVLRGAGVDPRSATTKLASVLDVDPDVIERRLRSDRYFVWIERRVSPAQAKRVTSLDLAGVTLTKEPKRFYPNRELAAHVLGFANVDGKGIEGLELALDEQLRGSTDTVPAIRDRRGLVVFSEQLLDDRATQGDDVHLTLDKTIQHIAERELDLAVRTFEARAGSVVVMDPRTGEFLAIANHPRFNPNFPGSSPVAHRRNRAITDRFEPGSTIKPFTVAAALAAGSIRSDQRIDCEQGAMEIADHTIHDTRRWDMLTPAEILRHSSNIGTAKVGLALGRRRLYRSMRRFGFGRETGVPLPGETEGILRHYKRWYEVDVATISFGQGMSTTNIQLASAMGALANRGRLMKPLLVKRVRHGQQTEDFAPRARRQVVSGSVARLVADMLTSVTGETGTGQEAALEDFLVAGKTGTAQKADYVHGGYAEGKWTSSFLGFVPADRPRLVISVLIDEPVIAHHGGMVAAPVFRRIAAASLRHLGVTGVSEQVALSGVRKDDADPADATSEAPAPEPARRPGKHEALVPRLVGSSARQALVRVHDAHLRLSMEGSGVVVEQRPRAHQLVSRGTEIQATLRPPDHIPEGDLGEQEQQLHVLAQAAEGGSAP